MLPAMKITEPYSPTARARASAKPVRMAGYERRKNDPEDRLIPACPECGGGLFYFAVELLENRLDRTHDEGQSDEDQGNEDAERRIGDFDSERCEPTSDPAVRRIDSRQGDAGDGRRKSEGQIDECVQQALARKAVSDKHPSDDDAEDGVDARGKQRGHEAQAQSRQGPRIGDDIPEARQAEACRLDNHGGERDEND